MKNRTSILLLIIILSVFIFESSNSSTALTEPYEIVYVELVSGSLVSGMNMTVDIQFGANTNATYAKLYIFQITENMNCLCDYEYLTMDEVPTNIYAIGSKRFQGNYTINFLVGMQIGYRIQIFYENATIKTVPDTENFMGLATIEPLNNEVMFDAGKVQRNTDQVVSFFLPVFGAMLIIARVVRIRKKNL